jgi:rhodanese-related sulfurtransferase
MRPGVLHRGLAVVAATVGLAAAAADMTPAVDVPALAADIEEERDHISAVDLADRIVRADPTLRVFDLRSPAEYEQYHVPSARHATIADLLSQRFPPDATIVLYSEGGAHAAQAWVLLRLRGHGAVFFLREGIYEWIARVSEPRLATDATAQERGEFERAAALSRFFGGVPREGVARAEVPVGYWSAADPRRVQPAGAARAAIASIRRRGC